MNDRLRELLKNDCEQVLRSLREEAPDFLIALNVNQVWWSATALLGDKLWEEFGRVAISAARMRVGLCQHCDTDLQPDLSHPPICPGCAKRFDAEIDSVLREMKCSQNSSSATGSATNEELSNYPPL